MNPSTRPYVLLLAGACLTAVALQPIPVHAQDQVPPQTPQPTTSQTQVHASPAEWVRKALQSNKEEIALSEEAAQRTSNVEVRQYAQMLVRDHKQTSERLAEIGKRLGISAPITSSNDNPARTRLAQANAAEFDRAYLDLMSQGHQQAIASYTDATQLAQADVATYARETLPTLRRHQQQANLLKQSLGPTSDAARNRTMDNEDKPPVRDYE